MFKAGILFTIQNKFTENLWKRSIKRQIKTKTNKENQKLYNVCLVDLSVLKEKENRHILNLCIRWSISFSEYASQLNWIANERTNQWNLYIANLMAKTWEFVLLNW